MSALGSMSWWAVFYEQGCLCPRHNVFCALNFLRPCLPSFLAACSREEDFYEAIPYQKHFMTVTCNVKLTESEKM